MLTTCDHKHSRRTFIVAYVCAVLLVQGSLVIAYPDFVNGLGLWAFAAPLWLLPTAPILWLAGRRRLSETILISTVVATVAAFCFPFFLFSLLLLLIAVQLP